MSKKYSANSLAGTQNQLIQWINDAGMAEGVKKVNLLRKITEILLHQGSEFVPALLENILSFASDKSNDVKKQIIVFIEEVSKLFPENIPKVIAPLRLLITDTVAAIQKRAIQGANIVYKNSLLWICSANADVTNMQYLWKNLSDMKLLILNMIDSENEGIRTHSIKFLEQVVLLQSSGENEKGFSLDKLPSHLPFIKRSSLEEESEHIFNLLIKFHNSQHISSVNLMACMTTLCLLAKSRPQFMARVVQAMGDLHTTLPPTLSQSQVNSVRKHLKMLLVNLMKHSSSNELVVALTQLLLDIGMTHQEINKVLPKERRNKRLGELKANDIPMKKLRIDSPQNSQSSDSNSRSDFNMFDEDSQSNQSAVSTKSIVTEDLLFEGLNNVDNVVSVVMATLQNNLPDEMPPNFVSTYNPIPNSGSKLQKRHLAKLIMALINKKEDAPVTPPSAPALAPAITPAPAPIPTPAPTLSEIAAKIPLLKDEDEEKITLKNAVAKLQESTKAERKIENAVSKLMEETRQEHLKEEERKTTKEKERLIPPPTPTIPKLKQKVKLLKLQEITRPLPKEMRDKLVLQAVNRILRADKESVIGGVAHVRAKFITIFASSYTPETRELVLNYILEDPGSRIDLAMAWLYEEYAFMQGFNRHPVTLPKIQEKHGQNYNQLLCALITQICERGDPGTEAAKDMLLRKIYIESPVITEEAIDYLKHLINEEKMALLCLEILEEICLMRPPRAHKYVTALVSSVLNHNDEIRDIALKAILKIYERSTDAARKVIEKHALLYLGFISLSHPPSELLGLRSGYRVPWSDNLYKLCLNLIMTLFPKKEELIIEVARVYGTAGAEAKRVVLRAVEGPVRSILVTTDMETGSEILRPAFAQLLDECPRGSETLLTRFVHIMTEKSPPSQELVSKVRNLYATRVSDVRFLIPVLTGLTKREILAALPKLIKLNPVVVKEVFNKLLGLQNPYDEPSPVTPAELLVELHLIDPSNAELKYIIKATALCFGEKQIYTQDVISAVLQRLSEEPEIPVLMMRSVLQALTLYPGLGSLTLNILQLLIEKEVWNNKVAWEGWIKCMERLIPASSFLLTLLPAAPLAGVLSGPLRRTALLQHVDGLPSRDRAMLPPHVLQILAQVEAQYSTPMPVPPPQQNPMEPLPPGMEL